MKRVLVESAQRIDGVITVRPLQRTVLLQVEGGGAHPLCGENIPDEVKFRNVRAALRVQGVGAREFQNVIDEAEGQHICIFPHELIQAAANMRCLKCI